MATGPATDLVVSDPIHPSLVLDPQEQALHAALEPFLDLAALRQLAASGTDLSAALRTPDPPTAVRDLLSTLRTILRPPPRTVIHSPKDAVVALQLNLATCEQEELWMICLDTCGHMQAIVPVYRGTVKGVLLRIGEIFKEAIRYNSSSIIVCHNHPTGLLKPSPDDIWVTEQLWSAGQLLEIELTDHLIVGPGGWISLRQQGLGFPPDIKPAANRRRAMCKTPRRAKVAQWSNGGT